MDRMNKDAPNNVSIVASAIVDAVTFFTEPLPSKERTHIQTQD
jgi:hypothetical protein